MAILQGFPPVNTISPSVRIAERDLSFITATPTFHRAGIVGFASKGPIGVPTLIQTLGQLRTVFGLPHPDIGDPYLIYAAQQYLLIANELFVVRVAVTDPVNDEAAQTASIDVPVAGGQIKVYSSCMEPYVFATNQFFRFRLNGQLSQRTLVALATNVFGISAADLAQELNEQIDFEQDGIEFYVHSDSLNNHYIGVETVWAYGPQSSLEFVSVQNSMYGVGGITCLGSGMTQAQSVGACDRYPLSSYTPGVYDFTGLTSLNLQIVVDGTDNVTIDSVIQTADLTPLCGSSHTIAQIVTYINTIVLPTLPGGWVAFASGNNLGIMTLASGKDSRLLIKSSSTAFGIFCFSGLTAAGTSPSGTAAFDDTTPTPGLSTFGLVTGSANTNNQVCFTLTADTPGIDGNLTQVIITNNLSTSSFNLNVFNNGQQVEAWGNLVKDPSSSFYIETYLSLVSDYIRAIDNTGTSAGPTPGTYQLGDQVGTDGIPSDPDDQDALLVGDPSSYTGLYILSDPEQIEIDLVAIPGHTSTTCALGLLDLCQNVRGDCLAIIDPPFGLTVQEIIAWQNGTHPLNTVRFDSDFGALYWPWLKIHDGTNNVDVWVPPSGSVMATIANSDNLSFPWFAPAGMTRGVVPGVLDVFTRPTLTERDSMYGNQNCINPIIQFVDVAGFLIWGQKTLQRLPSALDRINVRRLMFYCERTIKNACRILLFEPNDAIFVHRFETIVKQILNTVQTARGLSAYIINDGPDLNTPDIIARNEFRAQIGIQPILAVEFIFLEFSVQRQGDITQADLGTF
jgi:uncharacterized protein